MKKYYLTFGQTHTHPKTGDLLKDHWIVLMDYNKDGAQKQARQRFGDKWSRIYEGNVLPQLPHHFPKGEYKEFEMQKKNLSELFEEKVRYENNRG